MSETETQRELSTRRTCKKRRLPRLLDLLKIGIIAFEVYIMLGLLRIVEVPYLWETMSGNVFKGTPIEDLYLYLKDLFLILRGMLS